jgi:hypothetical protein
MTSRITDPSTKSRSRCELVTPHCGYLGAYTCIYRETSAQYREFAEECDRLAKQAKTDGERKTLEEMAKAWRMVAAEADNKR